jgi:hypothetical protein
MTLLEELEAIAVQEGNLTDGDKHNLSHIVVAAIQVAAVLKGVEIVNLSDDGSKEGGE